MKSSQKNARKGRSSKGDTKSSSPGATRDLVSGKLSSLGRKLGNEALDGRIQDANGQQKNLLNFIVDRLRNVQHVQTQELQEMKNSREWFREVARGEEGYTLPDTTRWHSCALLYQRAGQALCRGDLGRGAELLEQATKAELKAQEEIPKQVKEKLKGPRARSVETPASAGQISSAAACRSIGEPQALKLADQIRNVADVMENSPPLPVYDRQWWETNDEDEEQNEDEDEDEDKHEDKHENEEERLED